MNITPRFSFQIKIMDAISKAMNFKYTISPPSDGGLWGEEVTPGNFSGIAGELQKEYVDIIWANLFVVPDRFKYIDYAYPHATDYVCYMVFLHILYHGEISLGFHKTILI